MTTTPVRYSDLLRIKVSPALAAAVDQAALASGVKPSQWVRSALATGLALAGVDTAPRDVG
jgi:hypothetical protein